MGRKSNKQTFSNTAVDTALVEPLLARFDSPEADYFAIVTQGVDRHRLRVFDTHTGTTNNDYSSNEEDRFTCLSWGNILTDNLDGNDAPPPKKRKRRSSQHQQYSKVIALGLQNGSIAIYSITHGDIIKTLSGQHTLPLNDFVFSKDGKKAYSCAEDMNITEWDLEKGNVISKWKYDGQTTKFIISLSHDETKLLSAGHTIKLWDLKTKKVLKSFTGHTSTITSIVFSSNDDICVSTAEHDRFINIWKCLGEDTQGINLAALSLDEDVKSLSMSKANTVSAISETGHLSLFGNVTSVSLSTSQSKKKKKYVTRVPDCIVKVINEDGSKIIPILSACFVDESENKEAGYIMIARGSTVKPIFEKVRFINEDDNFLQELKLIRHQPSGFLVDESNLVSRNLKAMQKPYDESKVKVVGVSKYEMPSLPSDSLTQNSSNNKEEPLETRLKNLDLLSEEQKTSQKLTDSSKFHSIPGNSVQQMLVQALHSNDDHLFHLVLEQTDPDIIENTIRKLPTKYVVPFLEKVIARFHEKPNAGMNILQWIKVVLLVHMTYLMTIPDLTRKLSNFYQTLDARSVVFQKLLSFQGRLDLVMKQISMRKYQNVDGNTNEPETIYVERSSEDEDASDEDVSDDEEESNNDNEDSDDSEEEGSSGVNSESSDQDETVYSDNNKVNDNGMDVEDDEDDD